MPWAKKTDECGAEHGGPVVDAGGREGRHGRHRDAACQRTAPHPCAARAATLIRDEQMAADERAEQVAADAEGEGEAEVRGGHAEHADQHERRARDEREESAVGRQADQRVRAELRRAQHAPVVRRERARPRRGGVAVAVGFAELGKRCGEQCQRDDSASATNAARCPNRTSRKLPRTGPTIGPMASTVDACARASAPAAGIVDVADDRSGDDDRRAAADRLEEAPARSATRSSAQARSRRWLPRTRPGPQ